MTVNDLSAVYMAETITFELIRRIHRQEVVSPKLVELPASFFKDVTAYLERKRRMAKKGRERMAGLEVKNIERLVQGIFNRRERKIVNLAIAAVRADIPVENLTAQERAFFDRLVGLLREWRASLAEMLTVGEELVGLVVFKEDVPQFVGADEQTYGPFKKGDIAKLPEENVKVLKERGIVEEFKVSR
jgi:DNA replication initiation complex subunit (GINS family)